jgi:hypothetical protein
VAATVITAINETEVLKPEEVMGEYSDFAIERLSDGLLDEGIGG